VGLPPLPSGSSPVWARGRFIWLALIIGIGAVFLVVPVVHHRLLALIEIAGELIRQRPGTGMAVFVLLAAVSAMMAFVSSAVLIPVAVHVWGPALCALLLWLGWFLGGVAAYLTGRYLGRPVVQRLVSPGTVSRYESWARSGAALAPVLLIQLAIPSDVAGYVFGIVRCRPAVFLPALALAEIPYALGAVYLGVGFLTGNVALLAALGVAGSGLSAWALARLHRDHDDRKPPASSLVPPSRT
jgi:uncharacterized membrane protein YdjX (TVP38/TMEM64 family)